MSELEPERLAKKKPNQISFELDASHLLTFWDNPNMTFCKIEEQ